MKAEKINSLRRRRRKLRVRKRVYGDSVRPRLTVTRSLRHISAQIVDDERGVTLCQASSCNKDLRGVLPGGGNLAAAQRIGTALAERAKERGIQAVRFDRNGYRYHGRVKALAEAVREGGLTF